MSEHMTVQQAFGHSAARLAQRLGDLRYDELAELLGALSKKVQSDALADKAAGRAKLAWQLELLATEVGIVAGILRRVWDICKPHLQPPKA